MSTRPPTDRELFYYRYAATAAAGAAVAGPIAAVSLVGLLPPPWNWFALLSPLLCGLIGTAAVVTGTTWHRPWKTVAGILSLLSAGLQLVLVPLAISLLATAWDNPHPGSP